MPMKLSPAEVESYARNGFLSPVRALTREQAQASVVVVVAGLRAGRKATGDQMRAARRGLCHGITSPCEHRTGLESRP